MSIGRGVVLTVPFQQVDNAPNAKASAESNNEGLQSVDCGSEKLHMYSFSPGTMLRPRKKPPIQAATKILLMKYGIRTGGRCSRFWHKSSFKCSDFSPQFLACYSFTLPLVALLYVQS